MKLEQRFNVIKNICKKLANYDQIQGFGLNEIIYLETLGCSQSDFYHIKSLIKVFLTDISKNNTTIFKVDKQKMIDSDLIEGEKP